MYFCLDDIKKNFDVNQISTFGTGKYLLSECTLTCGRSLSAGLLEQEMNNVIVEKRLDYIYISNQFRVFCVTHRKTRVLRERVDSLLQH